MIPLQEEIEEVAARFGVATSQVWRDHLISHVLAAIAQTVETTDLIFFGGTALSRTHLRGVRLSEDIDPSPRASAPTWLPASSDPCGCCGAAMALSP